MNYMRSEKVISSRDFQQQFAKISKQLQAGESIAVTNRGKRIGTFTKAGEGSRQVPDFYANLQKLGRSKADGQKMIDQILNDLP